MLTRSKTKKTQTIAQCLPQDVLPEILQCLPLKSLIRFKLICKQWNSLISDPQFFHRYKTRHSGETHLIVSTYSDWKPLFNIYTVQDSDLTNHEVESHELMPLQQPVNSWSYVCTPLILGTYNGLVAILYAHKRFILWNPLTQEHVNCLTTCFVQSKHFIGPHFYGLCYNKSRDEYIALVAFRTKLLLLNFQTSECKTLHEYNFFLGFRVYGDIEGVVISGVPHWAVETKLVDVDDKPENLIYFDLEKEKFKELDRPDQGGRKLLGLGALNGQSQLSALVSHIDGSGFEVWVKDESESWTNRFMVPYLHNVMATTGYVDFLGFTATGELLINVDYKGLWCVDPQTGKSRKIKLPFRGKISEMIAFSYNPSLTSVPS